LARLRYPGRVPPDWAHDVEQQAGQAIGQVTILKHVVSIQPVALVPMQVDIVEAGAAVEDRIVEDAALQVHHSHHLPSLDRHAVNRNAWAQTAGHIPV